MDIAFQLVQAQVVIPRGRFEQHQTMLMSRHKFNDEMLADDMIFLATAQRECEYLKIQDPTRFDYETAILEFLVWGNGISRRSGR